MTRSIASVEIGNRYSVVVGGRPCVVRIERQDSGVWLGFNETTGASLYVTFRDLGEQLVDSELVAPRTEPLRLCDDFKRRASGERDDDE